MLKQDKSEIKINQHFLSVGQLNKISKFPNPFSTGSCA